jgi:hypothetical protein
MEMTVQLCSGNISKMPRDERQRDEIGGGGLLRKNLLARLPGPDLDAPPCVWKPALRISTHMFEDILLQLCWQI